VTLTVATNSNDFATYQSGNNNSIVGLVNTGTGNQAVVTQVTNLNTASFTQSGQGNTLGINQ
jgi:hypothetical protein